jgi:hypothetical protein
MFILCNMYGQACDVCRPLQLVCCFQERKQSLFGHCIPLYSSIPSLAPDRMCNTYVWSCWHSYSHAPHNDVSVNSRSHIWQWSHKIIIQCAYKLLEYFAKPYFHKYWTEIHDVTTVWKRNVCSFIVTFMLSMCAPRVTRADVQAILPFPPNPLKHVLCDVPDCGVVSSDVVQAPHH